MVKSTRCAKKNQLRLVAQFRYPYTDITGAVLFYKVRYSLIDRKTGEVVGKTFGYRSRNGRRKPPEADSYPYQLRALYTALSDGDDLLICEGEKDCELAAEHWEIAATTHHQGSAGWSAGQAAWFARGDRMGISGAKRSHVYIAVDRDKTGAVLAWDTFRLLVLHGRIAPNRITFVKSAVPRVGADIGDHIAAGLPASELIVMRQSQVRDLARAYVSERARGPRSGSGPWSSGRSTRSGGSRG